MSGPASPVLENLHRFPSESLHSFSFAKQSEETLHVRQNILQKSIDFVRSRSSWAIDNPGLVDAQARVSGDPELQGMMDLLKKANILPIDTSVAGGRRVGLGPLTGPAHLDGRNVFDKSFSLELDNAKESLAAPNEHDWAQARKYSLADDEAAKEAELEMQIPPTRSDSIDAQAPGRAGLKRTYTDVHSVSLQQKLIEALAQPYAADDLQLLNHSLPTSTITNLPLNAAPTASSAVHSHSSKWSPAHQAVFRTSADAPWTILAANDIACLIFGVTRAEVRSLSILGVIQEERRQWLESRLSRQDEEAKEISPPPSKTDVRSPSLSLVGSRSGITARLLSKAPSRANKPSERAKTDDGAGGYYSPKPKNHPATKSRGVLLCGDIVPIQRRDGTKGAASFWVMEKRGGLIWVIEEITEDVAYLDVDEEGTIQTAHGDIRSIWGQANVTGTTVSSLLPKFPLEALESHQKHEKHYIGYFAAETVERVHVPTTVEVSPAGDQLRVSSLPHIAGVMVLDPTTLKVTSSNSIFSAALFGHKKLEGLPIADLIPSFQDVLNILRADDQVELVDGIVVPEHSFRRARTILSLREGRENPAHIFLRPCGVPAKHKDGSDIMVDIQMRVIRSETVFPVSDEAVIEEKDEVSAESNVAVAELVYALWIIYSRNIHGTGVAQSDPEPVAGGRPLSPPSQPEPPAVLPSPPVDSDKSADSSQLSLPTQQDHDSVAMDEPLEHPPPLVPYIPHQKKTIEDFTILEEMGSGAYGQVKLVRYKKGQSRKMVLKYVTKKRILVDTWTRDRKLGTVPLEIHVLDFLRRDGLRHPNIVEMIDFFEDDVNYYIEMLPHGIPGMDLFDYIELRTNMTEDESRNIFRQVVDAIHHLHTKALVVHRDIKDENVVLDGEGKIKLIDFGSAAYIKNGPFDVFVGTIGKLGRRYDGALHVLT
jgi:protein-serine/threonine kinase